jgi:hypothetical protein
MRTILRSSLLVIFLLSSATVAGADLEKGLAAFAEGNYETALAECQPLADEGNVGAQFCLGRMYANGFGVAMDDALALKWYGLAAAAGHAEAQYNLAVMHANGWGVVMDDVPAVGFYQLAAEQGYVAAQTALGFCYKHGAGVEKNLQTAYMWFDVAAHNDDLNAASERENLGDRLSEDEVLAAQSAALQWLQSDAGSDIHAGRIDE